MSYRNPNATRINAQSNEIRKYAGQTAVWRQFISATSGIPEAGIGSAVYYREQWITGVFGQYFMPSLNEMQTPAGQTLVNPFSIITREKLDKRDEIIWRDVTYRVEGDPVPSRLNGQWAVQLKRGTP